MLKDYLLQNWELILVLFAFAITLNTSVFMEKHAIRRMYLLIITIFLLSIVVFFEFRITNLPEYRLLRVILMAIRYTSTPVIIAQIVFTLVKKQRWFIFIPAIALLVINVVSIFTGIVFSVDENNTFHRGPLGLLPFIFVGLYSVFLIYILIKRSNKHILEIIPILFLCFAFASGLVLPFVFEGDYSQIFCSTIAVALYVYYVFSILQLTKKDSLTGLLNRQAYYADINRNPEDITALVSIDMNGLKKINDNLGHAAGDDALITISICFNRALKRRQSGFRIGGDEFVIICRKNTKGEVEQLVERIKSYVGETKYSCSVGYCYSDDGSKSIDEMLKESDEMMYEDKAEHYRKLGK